MDSGIDLILDDSGNVVAHILVHNSELALNLIQVRRDERDLMVVQLVSLEPFELRDNGLVQCRQLLSLLDAEFLQAADFCRLLAQILLYRNLHVLHKLIMILTQGF